MREFLAVAVLGLGVGAIYGLLGQGLVAIYRGSGIVNFSQGALAMVSGYIFYQFNYVQRWPSLVAVAATVVLAGLIGCLIQVLIMWPMRKSAPLVRLVATIALLTIFQSLVEIKYGTSPLLVASFLPVSTIHLAEGIYFPVNQFFILLIGVVLTATLWCVYRFTQFGRATQAVAQDERIAAALGYSPNRIAALNWAIGSALAGLGGCLLAPLSGLDIASLSNLVVPALAVGVVSSFRSFPGALGVGLLVGIIESEVTRYVSAPGWGESVPFLLIIALLAIRGTNLPLRDYLHQRLPAVSPGTFKRRYLILFLAILLVAANFTSIAWTQPLLVSLLTAIVGLSVVVITGYAGQLSLIPYGLAGLAGLIAAQFASHFHLSLIPAMIIGVLATVVVAIFISLPALRTRGVNLAIITLGFSVVISDVILANPSLTGTQNGVPVGNVTLFGWSIDTVGHINRYASVVAVIFIAFVLMVINLRRSSSGLRMVAVRDNERAAASIGVNVISTKLVAFGLSALIAAVGGILTIFQTNIADFNIGFDDLTSMGLIGLVVLGGIGFASGAVMASTMVVGGIVGEIFLGWQSLPRYLPLIGGVMLITQLIVFPDGIMPGNFRLIASWRQSARTRGRKPGSKTSRSLRLVSIRRMLGKNSDSSNLDGGIGAPKAVSNVAVPRALKVEGLSVTFGGVTALDDFSIDVSPGEIVGLIGPNGAGKTTAIDAIAGLVRSSGSVSLGGDRIDGLRSSSRAAKGLGRSFQSIELFSALTVAENLSVAYSPWRVRQLVRDLILPRARDAAASSSTAEAVRDFDIAETLAKHPDELPFAQRRLVGIAQAVSRLPSVLLLDEPAAGLDAHEVRALCALITSLAKNRGMSILLVEHNLDMVVSICDRLLVLDRGREIAQGPPDEMLRNEDVKRVYTGVSV